MITPRHKWQFVLLASLLYVALPVVNAISLTIARARGAFPPNADSIAIPILQTACALLVLSPLSASILWLAARGYRGGRTLLSFDTGKPLRSTVWSLLLGGLAALLLAAAAQSVLFTQPVDTASSLAWAYLTLCLRSSLAGTEPAGTARRLTEQGTGR